MSENVLQTGVNEDADRKLFERISHQYCRKDLMAASRRARRLRLLQTVKQVLVDNGQALLEVGCGAGFSAKYLQGKYSRYVGIDYSQNLIDLAKKHVSQSNTEFRAVNIKDLNEDKQFDGAFMIGVLHHLAQPDEAVRRIQQCLKPGGWFALNEPSAGNPLFNFARRIRKKADADYSDEQITLSKRQMHDALARNGFVGVHTYGQGILSTPFAEVVMPQSIALPLSFGSCWFDRLLEAAAPQLVQSFSWNLVAIGYVPR